MKSSDQVCDSAETAQGASVVIPGQDQPSVLSVAQIPLQAGNGSEPVVTQTCSDWEQTSTTSENETLLPGSSALDALLRAFGILGSLDVTAAVDDQTGDETASDGSGSPVVNDGMIDIWDVIEGFCSSRDSTDADLPILNLLIQFISEQDSLSDTNDSQPATRLLMLSQLLLNRATILDALPDIDRAIECLTRAIQTSQAESTTLIQVLRELAMAYRMRFDRYGRAEDINSAIGYQHQTITRAGDKHENYAILMAELGNHLLVRYGVSGDLNDIHGAIEYETAASFLIPETDDSRASLLSNLSNSHSCRFRCLGQMEDINKAIDCITQAVQLTPERHQDTPIRLNTLGISYSCRFEGLGELEDINKSIDYHTLAVQLTPERDPVVAGRLSNLGTSHLCRFERLGELVDIHMAIECQTRAVQLTQDGHPDMPNQLSNLSNSYRSRFQRLGELEDISKAIEYQTRAVQLTPEGHPDILSHFSNLGNSYLRRFERLGELEDISRAIDCHTQVVQLTPDGHPGMSSHLNDLGNFHRYQFERLRELEDISKAIVYQTRAVQLTPERHPDMPSYFGSLGNSYLCRFESLGELEDIKKAIECHTMAVQVTTEGDPDMPHRFSSLGSSYGRRFERLGELEDIDRAIECHKLAFQLTPEGHPDIANQLSDLGNPYVRRFGRLKEPEDIRIAIECQTRAVQLTPEKHPDMPRRLNNLGNAYLLRFQWLGEPENIDSAITAYNRALHLLPQTHMLTSIVWRAVGASHMIRSIRTETPEDMVTAFRYFQAVANSSAGSPSIRFAASRHLTRLLSMVDRSESLPGHRMAMQLLPDVIWLGLTSNRRYELITEMGAVAVEAAAAAISVKDYGLALEWLEEGRSIVWNQTLQFRTPFAILATVSPVLAQDLQQVAMQLEIANRRISDATPIGAHTMSLEQATLHHHRLVGKYNQLISQARELPDFQDLMRSKDAAELLSAAQSGPVVVINVHKESCDALILFPESNELAHMPLPDISQAHIFQLHGLMIQTLRAKGVRERTMNRLKDLHGDRFKDILSALWHKLVKPILGSLKYTSKLPANQLPHITWCVTGALSFLPIHAAGDYHSGEDRIFEYAITSYTPTLSALLATTPRSPVEMSGVLAVSQESTPGLSNLPGTKDELAYIEKHVVGLPYMQLENSQATPKAVLDAMEQYACIHLACHASQNAAAPTQSCFHLHSGTLSLDEIAQRSLKNKSLAFLSACQTATGDQNMPDEAVHLAAGMLIAGYPSVIATMWSISDSDAPLVADQVYGQLARDGKLDFSQVARALHVAAGELRASVGEEAFSRWVPYIHIGR